jgi:hypothetical protein
MISELIFFPVQPIFLLNGLFFKSDLIKEKEIYSTIEMADLFQTIHP